MIEIFIIQLKKMMKLRMKKILNLRVEETITKQLIYCIMQLTMFGIFVTELK
jgi:hypothetical protein